MPEELDRRRLDILQRIAVIGITRKRLAEVADVDESCLGRFLNGYTTVKWDTIEKIEKALRAEERRALTRIRKSLRELESRLAAA